MLHSQPPGISWIRSPGIAQLHCGAGQRRPPRGLQTCLAHRPQTLVLVQASVNIVWALAVIVVWWMIADNAVVCRNSHRY